MSNDRVKYNSYKQQFAKAKEGDDPINESAEVKEVIPAMIVNCGRVNIRVMPSLTSDVLDILLEGDSVSLYHADGEWSYVCTQAGLEGYVMSTFIEVI